MAKLYCVPLGQNVRKAFYDKLQSVGYGKGVLVLPSRILMQKAQQDAPVRTIDIDYLATTILNDNGYLALRQINRRSQELVLQILVKYLADRDKLAYFQRLAEKKGFIKAITSLVSQLSRSGATEAEIVNAFTSWDERTGSQRQKDLEVAQLYSLYRAYLKDENWFDLEGKYRLAIWVLQNEQVKIRWQEVCLSDFYTFDALQLEFLKALRAHCNLSIGLMYEEKRENVFQAVRNTKEELEKFCEVEKFAAPVPQRAELAHLAGSLRRRVEPIPAADCVRTCQFPDRESEMRWVLTEVKQLLRSGVSADDILVTMRSFANYAGLRNIADEYGVPVSLPQSSNLNVQPLVEFVQLLLEAKSDNRAGAEAYLQLLTSDLGKLLFTVDAEAMEAARTQKYFAARSQVQGKVRELLGELVGVLQNVDACLEDLPVNATVVDFAEVLTHFLEQLDLERTLGALYKEKQLSLPGLKACLQTKQALQKCLQCLVQDYADCKLAQESIALPEFKAVLTEALQDYQVTLADSRSDGVLITECINAQGLAYKYIYVLGLREGEFPAGSSENWIYNDKERGELLSLGIDMPNTALAYAEDAYFFAALVAQAQERLVLTWHKDDKAGASSYVEEVQKLFTDVATEAIYTKEPASYAEADTLGQELGVAWQFVQYGPVALSAAMVDMLRARGSFKIYLGELREEELCQSLRKKVGSVFSPTMLETYAKCPFRFLGERVWQQRDFAEKDELAAPADEGSLLHDTLAKFMGRHLREKLTKYELDALWEELLQDLDEVCGEYTEAGRLEQNALWQAEQARLRNMLRQWLHLEYEQQSKWASFVPYDVEWDFSSRNGKPLCLKLPDGTPFSVIGRIDRLDSDGSKVFVTDYKLTSAPGLVDVNAGVDLQLPVYLLAVDALYGKEAAGGGYWVLKNAERKTSIGFSDLGEPPFYINEKFLQDSGDKWQDFKATTQKLLQDYVQGIYEGKFNVQPKRGCSPYCPLKDICRYKAQEQGGEADV